MNADTNNVLHCVPGKRKRSRRPIAWMGTRLPCIASWLVVCLIGFCNASGSADEITTAPHGPVRAVLMSPVPLSEEKAVAGPQKSAQGEAPYVGPAPSAIAASALDAADEHAIDFVAALQLAEVQNPDIGLSRQAIQEALALQLQARSLLLPSVHAGANYRDHQGVLQTSSGKMLNVDFSSLYLGNGALAEAAGTTVIPGVQLYAHVGDGIFAPLAARQLVASRSFQAEADARQILFEVTARFLGLVRAETELQALRHSEQDMAQAVKITREFAKVKQGRDADAKRAETAALLLHSQTARAEETLLTASAELTRTLSLDPAVRLRATAPSDAMFVLVDANRDLQALLNIAFATRPELAARSADIARKQIEVRQERLRPFLPTISLGFSAGSFGGGTNPSFGNFNNRVDVDLIAYWTLQNFGVGNHALQKERRSEQEQAVLEKERVANLIGRQVADSRALVLARQDDLAIARSRVIIAENAFIEDLKRIRGNVGLPIELLNSLNRLASARVDVARVAQDYNLAQMQLFVAIGQTPLDVSAKTSR